MMSSELRPSVFEKTAPSRGVKFFSCVHHPKMHQNQLFNFRLEMCNAELRFKAPFDTIDKGLQPLISCSTLRNGGI